MKLRAIRRIGFIDASGMMGHGMARNLRAKGYPLAAVLTVMGDAVHQSLSIACALGYGEKFVPARVKAQEQLTGATIVPR